MTSHYLKTSLRNLLKYKTHSFISALCLAVGIVCYAMISYVIAENDRSGNLPDKERRIALEIEPDRHSSFSLDEIKRLEETPIAGLERLSVQSYPQPTEIEVIDKEQGKYPFLVKYMATNPAGFSYNNHTLLYGPRLPEAPDEVVLSQHFARKAFGKKNPIGGIVHLTNPQIFPNSSLCDFKVVNVVEDNWQYAKIDCYFSYELVADRSLTAEAFLSPGTNVERLNKNLQSLAWQRGEQTVHPSAWLTMQRYDDTGRKMVKLLVSFIASLILISGLINFLKFIIQMFYNRQREVALRKCLGSDIRGLFFLLFAEVFWMMSAAFLLSLALTEIVISMAQMYISAEDLPYISLAALYAIQFQIYLGLLVVCLVVIGFPIYRLHKTSITRQLHFKRGRHVFRSVMMWLQLSIAIFFVGGVAEVNIALHKITGSGYQSLTSAEEKQIISFKVNMQRMWQHINPIINEIRSLPEIADEVTMPDDNIGNFIREKIHTRLNQPEVYVLLQRGNPHYLDFFRIPMQGAQVEHDAEDVAYVSERLKARLDKDSVQGMIQLDNQSYRIVGTYKALFQETIDDRSAGSVFIPSPQFSLYYFKVAKGKDTGKVLQQITRICRKYVPETLPLNIHAIVDNKQTIQGAQNAIQLALTTLAVISVLLVVLSIYSAISLDTISRQKEVAIRKINGATPRVIGFIFGKAYLLIFLLAFVTAYPLMRLLIRGILQGAIEVCSWESGVALFVGMALLVLLTTAYKINRIMHINPAEVIKNE